jgi:hypothetical protein
MASRACQMGPKMEICTRTRSWWEKKAHAEENPQTGTADARPGAKPLRRPRPQRSPAARRQNPSRPLPRRVPALKPQKTPPRLYRMQRPWRGKFTVSRENSTMRPPCCAWRRPSTRKPLGQPARAPQPASRPRRNRPGLRTAPARRGRSPVCWGALACRRIEALARTAHGCAEGAS